MEFRRVLFRSPQPTDDAAPKAVDDEEAAIAHTTYDIKKAFGAIARIDKSGGNDLGLHQRRKLDAFIERYAARTRKSKEYTQANRRHMADPRVVNGFKPMLKEMTYQIRSEEHTSELQSLMRISYAVFCLKKKNTTSPTNTH